MQTVDFFTPIVDEPFAFGQIAAANALSDVYAMGGRPLTAMNILGIPTEVVPQKMISSILRGGAATLKKANCVLVGGHSIWNPEPIYGLSVTGIVSPRRMITNAAAKPGDVLILTKPLGTGIITTGIKNNHTSIYLAKKAMNSMRHLNTVGSVLAERGLVGAGSDITGFGLLGHLQSLCKASKVGSRITADRLPLLGRGLIDLIKKDCIPKGSRENLDTAEAFTDWGEATGAQKILLTDAQTSGGLLLCVAPKYLDSVLKILKKQGTPCATVIGRIIRSKKPTIEIR